MLDAERDLFRAHQAEWLKQQSGKCVLIKGSRVVGFFPTQEDALSEGARLFGLDSFLVRPVEQKDEAVYIPALALGILRVSS